MGGSTGLSLNFGSEWVPSKILCNYLLPHPYSLVKSFLLRAYYVPYSLLGARDPTVSKMDLSPVFMTLQPISCLFCFISYLMFFKDFTQQLISLFNIILHFFQGFVGENLESRNKGQIHPSSILLLQLPESLLEADLSFLSLESGGEGREKES